MKRGKGQMFLAATFLLVVVCWLKHRALAGTDQSQNEQEQMTGSLAAGIHDLKTRLAQQAAQMAPRRRKLTLGGHGHQVAAFQQGAIDHRHAQQMAARCHAFC